MVIGAEIYAPAVTLPGKELPVSIGWETDKEAQSQSGLWRREEFFVPLGNRTKIIYRLARGLVAVPNDLTCLIMWHVAWDNISRDKIGNVRMNVTLRRVRVAVFATEKQ